MNAEKKENLKGLLIDLLIAVVIVAVITIFLRPTVVRQTSMEPSLEPGDYLLVSRQAYRLGDFHRGDVIVFRHDEGGSTDKRLLIKRVIGLPGDVITVTDGALWINGSKVKEDYLSDAATPGEIYNLRVPDGQLFVLGDHRSVSMDSRAFGCISKQDVKGRAVLRLFPVKKAGWI